MLRILPWNLNRQDFDLLYLFLKNKSHCDFLIFFAPRYLGAYRNTLSRRYIVLLARWGKLAITPTHLVFYISSNDLAKAKVFISAIIEFGSLKLSRVRSLTMKPTFNRVCFCLSHLAAYIYFFHSTHIHEWVFFKPNLHKSK